MEILLCVPSRHLFSRSKTFHELYQDNSALEVIVQVSHFDGFSLQREVDPVGECSGLSRLALLTAPAISYPPTLWENTEAGVHKLFSGKEM